jgi:tetratricopeptide (TPR) repeat protein
MPASRNRQPIVRGNNVKIRSRKTRLLFLAIPYVVVFGVLWIVNGALPYFDRTLDVPFARDIVEDGIPYRQINRGYLYSYFPAGSPLIPELKSTYVLRDKPQNGFRVLCIGESSMFGVPYAFAATIPTLVRKQLRHLYPGHDIEVINLAASAINTNVIRDMVPQFLSLDPDLVLVYTGHNEFYGPEGVGASWLERQIPALTGWKYRIRRLPIVHALQRLITRWSQKGPDGEGSLMRQVSGGAEVTLNSPDAERVFRQFEENLREIVQPFRERGIPVILGDISSNMMFPPFAPPSTEHHDGLPQAIAARRYTSADSLLSRGLGIDSTDAYSLYWRGRLSLAMGDSVNAVHFLERARDHDRLKFRAPGRVNAIIHDVGRAEAVPVLPIDSLLRAKSSHGITDSMYFCEHLHPTFAGYDLIARTFVGAIIDQHVARLLPQPSGPMLPFNPDSLSVPWIDLGYGAVSLHALTTRWPFTDMPPRKDVLGSCEEWELQIAKEIYAGTLGWTDACLQYADNARQHRKLDAMVTALAALVEEYPRTYLFRYGLAAGLESAGRKADAIEQYRRAIDLKPGYVEAIVALALLRIEEKQVGDAEHQLEEFLMGPLASRSSPHLRARALYGLAVIDSRRDSLLSALGLVEESIRLSPRFQPALDLREKLQPLVK